MQTEKEEFYHLINFSIMAILKATVIFKNKSGLYPVYVRFTQFKQVSYVKTSLMVVVKALYLSLSLPSSIAKTMKMPCDSVSLLEVMLIRWEQ